MNMSTGDRFVRVDEDSATVVAPRSEPETDVRSVPPDWRARLPAKEGVARLQLLPGLRVSRYVLDPR